MFILIIFYGTDVPARAPHAFQSFKDLLHGLGLQTSPDKDCPPTNMVCLGVEVNFSNKTRPSSTGKNSVVMFFFYSADFQTQLDGSSSIHTSSEGKLPPLPDVVDTSDLQGNSVLKD